MTMLNDTNTLQHHPLRHPDNKNLHLHYDDTFEGFQLMRDKGPLIRESLSALKHTIDLALTDYSRILAFRVDLYVPKEGLKKTSRIWWNTPIPPAEFFHEADDLRRRRVRRQAQADP